MVKAMENNFFICGFMGSGKSLIAKAYSRITKINFFDLDELIRMKVNLSINDIFKSYGEEHFRNLEENTLLEFYNAYYKKNTPFIMALGGGSILRKQNINLIKKMGKLIFIDRDFELIYKNIKDDNERPLIKEKSKDKVYELFKLRYELYKNSSDFTLKNNKDISSIILELKNL